MHIDGIDEKGNKILELLQKNARMDYTEIAEQVGLSRVAVKNRIKKLEESRVIKGYETVIDPKKATDGIEFILEVFTEPDSFNKVADDLSKEECIRKLVVATGMSRMFAFGYATNQSALSFYVNQLRQNMSGVKQICLSIVVSVLKDIDGGVDYERENADNINAGTGPGGRIDR